MNRIKLILPLVLILSLCAPVLALPYGDSPGGEVMDKAQADSLLALITDDTPDSLKAIYYNKVAYQISNLDLRREYAQLSLKCCNHQYPELMLDNYALISNCYYVTNKMDGFLLYLFTGIRMATINGNNGYLQRFYKMMSVYYDRSNKSDSMFYYINKALEICVTAHDTVNMALCYQELGLKYANRCCYREAESCYRHALELDSIRGNKLEYAIDCYRLGELFVEWSKSDADIVYAKNILVKSVGLFESHNSDNYRYQIFSHLAYDALAKAYICLAEKNGNDQFADSCFHYNRLARNYFFDSGYDAYYCCYVSFTYVDHLIYYKRFKDALKVLLALKKNINKNNIDLLYKYFSYQRCVYAALGDYQNAYASLEKYIEYSRLLSNDSTMTVISDSKTEQAVMIERIKRESDLDIYRSEQRRMQTFNISLIVVLCLVFVLVIFILRALKFRQMANQELSEKNQLLNLQKNEIAAQRDEITLQRDEIETVNTELVRSINYAERIQRAAVPTSADIDKIFDQCFVFYRPRDIVSGDFFRTEKCGRYSVMVTADCTGHGIPGAFLSMLGISALKEFLVSEEDAANPGTVLDRMREFVKSTLVTSYDGLNISDGMDMTICSIEHETMQMRYAIANQRAYIVRKGNIIKLTGDKMPVGRSFMEREHFQSFTIALEHNDMLYMFTDGIQDQFGGEKQKKFKLNRLVETLVAVAEKPIDEQYQIIDKTLTDWRGDNPQVDDITMVGIRV